MGECFGLYSSADAERKGLSWRAVNPRRSFRASSPVLTLWIWVCVSLRDMLSSKVAVCSPSHSGCVCTREVMHWCSFSRTPHLIPPIRSQYILKILHLVSRVKVHHWTSGHFNTHTNASKRTYLVGWQKKFNVSNEGIYRPCLSWLKRGICYDVMVAVNGLIPVSMLTEFPIMLVLS